MGTVCRIALLLAAITACKFTPPAATDAPAGDDDPDGPPDEDANPSIPITFVQDDNDFRNNSNTEIDRGFGANQTAGNFNIVVISCTCTNLSVASVTDTLSNTYMGATGVTSVAGPVSFSMQIFYAADIAAGSNAILVTFNGGVNDPKLRIFEYAGIAKTNPVEGQSAKSGESQLMSSGEVTTVNAHDLLFSANVVASVTSSGTPNFMPRLVDDGDLVEDRVVTATGTYGATGLQTQTVTWVMQLVAFKGER